MKMQFGLVGDKEISDGKANGFTGERDQEVTNFF